MFSGAIIAFRARRGSWMSEMGMFRQLSSVRRAAAAASRSLLALPHSFRAAASAGQRLVDRCSTLLTRVFAPAASRRLRDALTAERTCFLVVFHRLNE